MVINLSAACQRGDQASPDVRGCAPYTGRLEHLLDLCVRGLWLDVQDATRLRLENATPHHCLLGGLSGLATVCAQQAARLAGTRFGSRRIWQYTLASACLYASTKARPSTPVPMTTRLAIRRENGAPTITAGDAGTRPTPDTAELASTLRLDRHAHICPLFASVHSHVHPLTLQHVHPLTL